MNNLIEYWTFDNHKIQFRADGSALTILTLDFIAKEYIAYTGELPDKVYLGLQVYEYSSYNLIHGQNTLPTVMSDSKLYPLIHLSTAGFVQLIPVIKPSLNFVLVGQYKDYARYTMGEIFEKEVLGK